MQLTDTHNCLDSEALVTAYIHIAKRLSIADYKPTVTLSHCKAVSVR